MTVHRRTLQILCTGHRMNVSIFQEFNTQAKDQLLFMIQNQTFTFLGHAIRRGGLRMIIIIQEKVEGKRNRGRLPICYVDQI